MAPIVRRQLEEAAFSVDAAHRLAMFHGRDKTREARRQLLVRARFFMDSAIFFRNRFNGSPNERD